MRKVIYVKLVWLIMVNIWVKLSENSTFKLCILKKKFYNHVLFGIGMFS